MTKSCPVLLISRGSSPSRFPRRSRHRQLAGVAVIALGMAGGCDGRLHLGNFDGRGPRAPSPDGGPANDASAVAMGTGGTFVPPVRTLPPAHPAMTSATKLDLLFLVDDSPSMAPLQEKMRARMGNFMDVLKAVPGGMPDVHVAVVSSSMGAGIYGNVPGCAPQSAGNLSGEFQSGEACTALHAGERFISSAPNSDGTRANNFDGDITDLFQCMASLGDRGCGFEHQFEATRLALVRAQQSGDANFGFLREEAYLGVVMLSNEDDCSVSESSGLFDPAQQSVSDPLGGLNSYRCTEFGHICDGESPPHLPPSTAQAFTSCVSNENGPLVRVNTLIDFLFGLKPMHPDRIFVAAIAGPTTPYVIKGGEFQIANGSTEVQPSLQHSCGSGGSVTFSESAADPGVRLRQLTQAFGPNSYFGSICADDFGPTMQSIAQTMVRP